MGAIIGTHQSHERFGALRAAALRIGKFVAAEGFRAAALALHRQALRCSGRPCRIRHDGSLSQSFPPSAGAPLGRPAAFARVFNLKSIAVVFYFCFLLIVGRFALYFYAMPFEDWAFDLVRGCARR